jgi:hypothetical protein
MMEVDFSLERRLLIRCPSQINNLGPQPVWICAHISFDGIDTTPNVGRADECLCHEA